MNKQEREELRRLEAALMEDAPTPAFPADDQDFLNEFWQEHADNHYEAYNTDDTDVDLEEYSEQVHRGRGGNGLSIVLTMLAMVALSAAILLFLKVLGVL